MNARDIESNNGTVGIVEGDKLVNNFAVVQEKVFIIARNLDSSQTGMIFQLVIITEFIAVDELINGLTAFAAKVLIIDRNFLGEARRAAVIAK